MSRLLSAAGFIERSSRFHVRSAWLLTGDEDSVKDLVQTSMLQSWLQGDEISAESTPDVEGRRPC